MNCNQIRELLPDLAVAAGMDASTLTPEPEREVAEHIASCAGCAAHLPWHTLQATPQWRPQTT